MCDRVANVSLTASNRSDGGARASRLGVLAAAAACALAALPDADAAFTGYSVTSTSVTTGGQNLIRYEIYANFNDPTDTVLNAYNFRLVSTTDSDGYAGFWHKDNNDSDPGVLSQSYGTWSPQFVGSISANRPYDSFVSIGAVTGATSSTAADPSWSVGGSGTHAADSRNWHRPDLVNNVALGWYNSSPPTNQGRVGTAGNPATSVRVAQIVLSAGHGSRVYSVRTAYGNSSATGPIFVDGSVTLTCPYWYRDLDGDGVGAVADGVLQACSQPTGYVSTSGDACPNDAAKTAPGVCGCGVADVDTDGDGTKDCNDGCPTDPAKTAVGACGCGVADTDSDGDGTANCNDGCPSDPAKTSAGLCGCGVADLDGDGDGLIDCLAAESLADLGALSGSSILSGDDFGAAVAVSGSVAVVGVPGDDVGTKTNCGSARVFARSGSSWSEVATLVAPDAVANDNFGFSVDVDGDAIVVGALNADLVGAADAGAAYVFRKVAGAWTYEAKLVRSGAQATDRFGTSVSILGDFVAVGAPLANPSALADAGAAVVFQRSAGIWTVRSNLTSAPATGGDKFGQSVDLGGAAATPVLAVGAVGDDETGKSSCGAVYVHALSSSGASTSSSRLLGNPAIANAGLGQSVTVDLTGARVASGAPLADFTGMTDRGVATAWLKSGATWSATNVAPPDLSAGDKFGNAIAFTADGTALLVGAPGDTLAGVANRGSVCVMSRRVDGSYLIHDRMLIAGGTSSSQFGFSVACGSGVLVAGAPKHTPPVGGAVRLFAAPMACNGTDTDSDGQDDCTDVDDDGDGTADGSDGCRTDALKTSPGTCGCGVADLDSDGDGVANCIDGCPSDPGKTSPGTCGCGVSDADSDGDGTANCIDGCPGDPGKTSPGVCGCGVAETGDTDGDTIADCNDPDDDGDGTADASDGCPRDPLKTSPGVCGCGVADVDSDSDGTKDCNDACPTDPAKTAAGVCGCGIVDADSDADGLVDCLGEGILLQTGVLTPSGLLTGDDYGASVAIDGDVAVVGSPYDDVGTRADAGSVRIFARSGASWTQLVQLTPADGLAKDYFGSSVAISGDVVAVGALGRDESGVADVGAVYVFRKGVSGWAFEQKLLRAGALSGDKFGTSVAVFGDLLAGGAPTANRSGLNDSGEVAVFRYALGAWAASTTLGSSPVVAGDKFGQSVAFGEVDAPKVLAIGAPGDDETGKSNCGAIYVHSMNASGLSAASSRLIAPAPIAAAGLGASVAVDETGTVVVAGAPVADIPAIGTDCGSATVWEFAGVGWSSTTLSPPDHSAGEQFGFSVAFSSGGTGLVIGSPLDVVGGVSRGSAAVFSIAGGGWVMHDRLNVAGAPSGARVGAAVAGELDVILVGSPKFSAPAGGTVRAYQAP